jgi:hypothetical protein
MLCLYGTEIHDPLLLDYETTYVCMRAVVQIQSMFRRYKAMRRVAVLRIEKAFIRATYDPTTYCADAR